MVWFSLRPLTVKASDNVRPEVGHLFKLPKGLFALGQLRQQHRAQELGQRNGELSVSQGIEI